MKLFKPYLYLLLDIGWVRIHTALFRKAWERDVYEYVRVYWSVFKWRGEFNLYRPGYSISPNTKKAPK